MRLDEELKRPLLSVKLLSSEKNMVVRAKHIIT